jgi:acetyl esterase/lipase
MHNFALRSLCILLTFLPGTSYPGAKEAGAGRSNGALALTMRKPVMKDRVVAHLSIDSTIGDVLAHPAFAAFSRLILPWDDRKADSNLRLRDIGTLLPYHSEVNPADIVSALNRMIDDAIGGKTIFYEFYAEAQKQAEPSKRSTGLFFFRGKPGAPSAIVCPGGGFAYVALVHEGFPYAVQINKSGYNVFVLRYRAGSGGELATRDLAAAISYVFRNAKALGIGVDNYSLWGSSAGARMAASIGSDGVAFYGGDARPRPSVVVMAYTGHSPLSPDDPPTFAVAGEHDGIAPPYVIERRIAALRRAGTPVEFQRFKNVGHGFGLGTGTSAEGWIGDAIRFWQRFMK